jgi:ABC-2 type transport system permease protein
MRPSAAGVAARLAWRRTWKGAAAVGASVVLVTVTAVLGYVAAYPDPADRVTLARSIGANPGLSALFGEPRDLATIEGFTEWRVVLILSVVGAVWALLATTRVLRGEEEEGRTEVLLAGPLTRSAAARAALAGLGASVALLLGITLVGLVAGTAREVGAGPAALLALSIVGMPVVMVGVGAVTSQVADTRRRATTAGAALLGAAYLARVVAGSASDLAWLRWLTPLGWAELAHPLTDPAPAAILLPYLVGPLLAAASLGLVAHRDTGAGLVGTASGRRPRTRLLGSAAGLAARLARGPALAWALALAVFGGLIGLVARTAAEAMADASGADVLGRLGIEESGARAYVGVSFVFITLLLMAAAAAQVAATRDEEASGRLEHLLVRPVTRGRWLGGRLVVTVGLLVLAAAAAALGALVAGRAAGLGVPAGDLLLAGLNALPAAVFVLGLGTLLHAVVPRAAATLTYAVVAGSFLLEVVGSAVALPGWVLNASVLHHVAPAPAVAPDPRSAAVLLGLGVLLAVLGGVGLRRRDLVGA